MQGHVDAKTKRRIAELRGQGWKYRAIMKEVGCSAASVKRHSQAPPDKAEPVVDPIEAERAKLAKRREWQIEKDLLQGIAGERSLRACLETLLREIVPSAPVDPPITTSTPSGATRESLLFLWSDWHAYEIVKPERVLSLNEYNAEVMARRVKRVVDTCLSIRSRMEQGGGWRFERAVVALNGDFVSGTIHEVERHTDAPSIVQAAFGTAIVLATALRYLAATFGEVEVFCTSGNHGRLPDARKMQAKDPTRSWDTLIYLIAREKLRDCPHVRFYIPESYTVAYEIEGWRFYQGHGDTIKSWMSIPFYGINRMASSLNALRATQEAPIHYWLFSHFHNSASLGAAGGEYFINGSLIGATEFSVNTLGRADPPQQWMLQVHPEHGITGRWPILGEGGDGDGYECRPWLN